MGRFDALSDLDYQDGWGHEPQQIAMHCVDCGAVVYIARDEPYPGPALRCQSCADKPVVRQPAARQGAA